MPTACNVGRLSGHVRQRACGLPYPTSGRRSRPSIALHVCFLTGAPRRWRPGRCLPFHVPIPPATSTNCPVASDGRGCDSLVIPRSGGRMAVALPWCCSPCPPPAILGAAPPAMSMVRRLRWGPVIGREQRRVQPVNAPFPLRAPAGDPTPIVKR